MLGGNALRLQSDPGEWDGSPPSRPCKFAKKNYPGGFDLCLRTILAETFAMTIRPRTARKMKLKNRRCPKCGCKLNPLRKRCKKCAQKL